MFTVKLVSCQFLKVIKLQNGKTKLQCMLTMNGLLDMPGPAMGCPKGVMEGLF